MEDFSGDLVLSGHERLKYMANEAQSWSAAALPMFARHQADANTPHPDHEDMLEVKKVETRFCASYTHV